ncbi:MAG: hypothetical protein AAB647_03695 [Patescibacteria group bacterium]
MPPDFFGKEPESKPELTNIPELIEQYKLVVVGLEKLNFLKPLKDGQRGIVIDNVDYPLPSEEGINRLLQKNATLVVKKIAEGLNKIELVPLLPLNVLRLIVERALQEAVEQNQLFRPGGTEHLKLTETRSVIDIDRQIFEEEAVGSLHLFPRDLSISDSVSSPERTTSGLTIKDLLDRQRAEHPETAGYLVQLTEGLASVPSAESVKTIAGRRQIGANQSSSEVILQLNNDSTYRGESGDTLYGASTRLGVNIVTNETVIDDIQAEDGGRASLLIGHWLTRANKTIMFSWHNGHRLVYANLYETSAFSPATGFRLTLPLNL